MLATSSTKKNNCCFSFLDLSLIKKYLLKYVDTWWVDLLLCSKPSRNRVCFLFAWRATLCTFKPYGTYGYLANKKTAVVFFYVDLSLMKKYTCWTISSHSIGGILCNWSNDWRVEKTPPPPRCACCRCLRPTIWPHVPLHWSLNLSPKLFANHVFFRYGKSYRQ